MYPAGEQEGICGWSGYEGSTPLNFVNCFYGYLRQGQGIFNQPVKSDFGLPTKLMQGDLAILCNCHWALTMVKSMNSTQCNPAKL